MTKIDTKRPQLSVLAYIVLAVGLAISLAAWKIVDEGERETAQLRHERTADDVAREIAMRMGSYEQLLRSAAALMAASETVERSEWKTFYESLHVEQIYPGVQGVGFARRVRPAELAAFEQRVRGEGFPRFRVTPPGARADMVAIDYLEPLSGRNLRAFGYDMYSDPIRREAMERARDQHALALTGRVRLMQETTRAAQPGTLLYFPVYRSGLPLQTVEQRRAALTGYVYCPFRMHDLLNAILGERVRTMQLQLYDGPRPVPDTLLFATPAHAAADVLPQFEQQRQLQIAGRAWTLRYMPMATGPGYDSSSSRLILIGGILFSLLSHVLILTLTSVRARALQLAAQLSVAHRSSEARMRAIFDSTADAILSVDMKGTILAANRVAEDMFGWPAQELIGQHTHLLAPERDHAWIDSIYASLQGTSWPRDYRRDMTGLHRDGHTFPVQVSGTEVAIDGVPQLVMLVRDVSRQKEAEELLRRSDLLRQALLKHAPFCILSYDLQGQLTALNPAGEQLLDRPAAEAVGQLSVLDICDPVPLDATVRPVFDVATLVAQVSRDQVQEGEWTAIRRDGSRVPVWAGIATLRDEVGDIYGFIGILHDITERKRAEEILARARDQAESANRAKSEFLANMSHEIRTPMNAVLGMAHLIGTEPLSQQQQIWLDTLNASGRSLLSILNDVLDFSKIEAGRMELAPVPFALDEVIASLAGLMTVNAARKNIDTVIHSPPGRLRVRGDALRLQQTLVNLVDNAIKFTEQGSVVVDISEAGRADGQILLCFAVRDTGIGMTPEQVTRLFQPFSQADNSMTRRFGGTGLGLAISRRIVRLWGSDIRLETTPGAGSTFSFTLPFDLLEDRPEVGAPVGGAPEVRLLVVGAAPEQQRAVAAISSAQGWQVVFEDELDARACEEATVVLCEWPAVFEDGLLRLPRWCELTDRAALPLLLGFRSGWRERIVGLPLLQHVSGLLPHPLTREALAQSLKSARPSHEDHASLVLAPPATPLAGMRLLLAEDNAVNQMLTRRLLERAGAHLDIVDNGQQAVERLRAEPAGWDAVLMDAQMPVMDGFTATRRLREELHYRRPIIALTAGVLKSEREHCLASGMDDFVPKPLDIELLIAVLQRHVPRPGTGSAA